MSQVHYITISQCPRHKNTLAITFDHGSGGQRVTSDKCCGEWRTVRKWPLTEGRIADIEGCLADAKDGAK